MGDNGKLTKAEVPRETKCASDARGLAEATATPGEACPACGARGKAVGTITLKAMLDLPLTKVRLVAYRFCRTPACPVVYYSADTEQTFLEQDIRERVHSKHPDGENVLVCYCLKRSPESIRGEIARTGRTTVASEINAAIRAGQCACDIRNPQGTCCLANVRAVVERLSGQLASQRPQRAL